MYNTTMQHVASNNGNGDSAATAEIYFIIQAVNFSGICQVLSLLGIVTNAVNIIVFLRIGFTETINISLMVLSLSDFGSCILMCLLSICMNPWFHQLDLPFDPFSVAYLVVNYPRFVLTKITTIVTAFISFERCVCVAMPLKVKTIISPSRVKGFMAFTCILVFASSVPFYFYQGLTSMFFLHLNKSLLVITYGESRERIEAVYYPIYNFFYSIFAFILVVIFTTILVINLNRKAAWRQTATTVTKEDSSKERRISKTVVLISCLFIVCYFPSMIEIMWMAVDPELAVAGAKAHIYTLFSSFMVVLETFNSSANTFIYYYSSSVYKSMFGVVFRLEIVKNKQEKNCKA